MNLTHQMQPTDNTCVCTCVAMLADCPASEIITLFHESYYSSKTHLHEILDTLNIRYTPYGFKDRHELSSEGVFLLTVPSLNIQAGIHQIIAVVDSESDLGWYILDPVKGREGKLYYTSDLSEVGNGAVFLKSYIIDAKIHL